MKLTNAQRSSVNRKLGVLCRERQRFIPMGTIQGYLAEIGVKLEEAIFCGREGRCNVDLFSIEDGSEVSNSVLVLYWLKGDVTATYEVNAYLS